jgi:hypothetical protein
MKTIFLKAAVLAVLGAAALPASAQGPRSVNWSGNVDDTAIVIIHGQDVRTNTVSGKSVTNINTQSFGRLPERPVNVYLQERHGRGQIRIVQQPSPDNDFTAKVRIHESRPGSSHYDFVLAWQPRFDGIRRNGY